ncbi:MAG: hypothetical protein HGA96_04260 [Desulfobulbaceae bacterium]|nr:hypothetical protein [Desulfobulbaceae bacterium]
MALPKFPGLQKKFEDSVVEAFSKNKSFNYNTVIKNIANFKQKYLIDDNEFTDLEKNLSNYIYRAIDNNIIISLGRKKGYRIVNDEFSECSIDVACENVEKTSGTIDVSKESFLHFPVTLLLSNFFNSKIYSLPAKSINAKWANPDMFMIRKNKKFELNDDLNLDLELLKMVDSSPELVVSSIELKYGLANRTMVLGALSETAINGSWANENWLVFFEDNQMPASIDEDCLDFAKANKIGIIRIKQIVSGSIKEYEMFVILQPMQRTTLQFNSEFAKSKEPLLKIILKQLKEFNDNGSYREQDGEYSKLTTLLMQASSNLTKQRQIPDCIDDLFDNYSRYPIFVENREYIQNLLPSLIGRDDRLDSTEIIKRQVGSSMSYDDLQTVLKILNEFNTQPKSVTPKSTRGEAIVS